jgi:hypothetical protein
MMDAVAIVWWTMFVAMTSFSIGVFIRVRLIRQRAARMIEDVENVTCIDYSEGP